MSISTELSELAQNGIQEIRERQDQGNSEAERREEKRFRLLILFGMSMMALTVVIGSWFQYRTEDRINQPQPAAVTIRVDKTDSVPILCPGDVLSYTATIDINEPNTGMVFVNVKNVNAKRIEIAEAIPRIDEETGLITVSPGWELPMQLPAIGARPTRPWSAGLHKRILAITSVEGDRDAVPESIPFIVSATCPGVKPG